MPNWDFRTNRWRDESGRFISAEQAQTPSDIFGRMNEATSIPVGGLPTSSFPVPIHQSQGLPIIPNVPFQPYTPSPVTPPTGIGFTPATWTQSGGFMHSRQLNEQGQLSSYGPDPRGHFMSFGQVTPQINTMAQSMVSLPQMTDASGNPRANFWQDTQRGINQANQAMGVNDYAWWGGSHIFRAGPVLQSMMPTTPEGTLLGMGGDSFSAKFTRRGGLHETLQFGQAPGVPMPMQTSPFSMSVNGQGLAPNQGYAFQGAFFRHNVLFGEGQGAVPTNLGYGINERTLTVKAPEGGFGFNVGDVFSHRPGYEPRNFMEGDTWRGMTGEVPGLPGTGRSYPFTRISGIQPGAQEGYFDVTVGESVPIAGGTSFKTGKKFNVTGYDPSFFSGQLEGVQFAGARPGAKYGDFAYNVLAAEYADRPDHLRSMLGLPSSGVITPDIARETQRRALAVFQTTMEERERLITMPDVRIDEQTRKAFAGKSFEFGGQQHQVLSNIRPMDDLPGSYLANYSDVASFAKFMERPRAELAQSMTTIKGEELDRMAQNQPGLYSSVMNRVQAGAIQRPAFQLSQAVAANRNASVRGGLNILNADDLDLGAIQADVLQRNSSMSAEQLDMELLRTVGQQTRGQHLQIGDKIFSPASVAASHIVNDREGNPISKSKVRGEMVDTYPSTLIGALKANENLRQLRQTNLPENLGMATEMRDVAVNKAMGAMETLYGHESTYERTYGLDMNVLAGPAQAMPGLPANVGVVSRQQLYQMMGANTKELRQQAMEAYRGGQVQLAASMYPHADPNRGWAVLKPMLEEDVRRLPGMSRHRVSEGNFGMSGMLAQWFEKDYDADYARAIMTQQFHEGKMVGNSVKPMSNKEITSMIGSGYAREFESIQEKAMQGNEEYWKKFGENFMSETTVDQAVGAFNRRGEFKPQIGQMYNTFNREMYTAGNLIGLRSEIGRDAFQAQKEALGSLAKFAYQPHLDEAAWAAGKSSLGEFGDMMRFLSYDSSRMPGKQAAYMGGPDNIGKPVNMPGLDNPQGFARYIAKTGLSIGREYAAENPEAYAKEVLPTLATLAVGQKNAANPEMVAQMSQFIQQDFLPSGELTPALERKMLGITGHKDIKHWAFGNQRGDMGEASVLGLMAGGATGHRTLNVTSAKDKYAGRSSNLPGFMGNVAGMFSTIRERVASATRPHGTDAELAMSGQMGELQELWQHTQSVSASLGGEASVAPIGQQTLPEVQSQVSHEQFVPPVESATPSYLKGRINAAEEVIKRRERFARTAQDPELRAQHEERLQINRQRISSYRVQNAPSGGGLEGIFGGGGSGGGGAGVAIPEDMPERPSGGGTSIGTQIVNQAPIKVAPGNLTAEKIGDARAAYDIITKNIEQFKELAKSTGNLTDEQVKSAKLLSKSVSEIQSVEQTYTRRRDTGMGGYAEDRAWQQMMETPGYHGQMEQARKLSERVARKVSTQEAEMTLRASSGEQPASEQLWDVLGQRGRSAAKKRQQWIDSGFFEKGGIETEGLRGEINSMFARFKSFAGDETGTAISGLLWRSSMAAGIGLYPQIRAGSDFQSSEIARNMSLYTGGVASYDDLMSGSLGRSLRGQVGRQQSHLSFGEQVYRAYGGLYEGEYQGLAQGPLGAAAGIVGPAAALGTVIGMSPLGKNVGYGIGTLASVFGAGNYISSAAQDNYAVGRYYATSARQGGLSGVFGEFGGAVGAGAMTLRDWSAGLSPEQFETYRTSAVYRAAELYTSGTPASVMSSGGIDNFMIGGVGRKRDTDSQQQGWSLNQLKRYAEGKNIPIPTALGMAQRIYSEQNSELSPEMNNANLDFWWRYMGNSPLSPEDNETLKQLTIAGINPEQIVQGFASTMGTAKTPSMMQGVVRQSFDWLQQTDTPFDLMGQRLDTIDRYIGSGNASLRMAGLRDRQINRYDVLGTDLENAPERLINENYMNEIAGNYSISSPSFARNAMPTLLAQARSFNDRGDTKRTQQILGSMGTADSLTRSLMVHGNSPFQSAFAGIQMGLLSPEQQDLAGSILSGDRLAISRFGARTGNQRLQILDPETGLPAFEEGINASEAAMLRADDPYNMLGQVSDAQLAGGTRGMQNELRLQGRAQRHYGRAVDLWQRQVSTGFQQGSFFEAAQVFQRFGMQLNVGTGQGYWDIEDAQRGINRQQEAYNVEQGGRNIDMQEAQFALAGRQFNEQWNFNRRQFNFQTTHQWSQMQRGFARQEVEWGWQREDMAFSRNQDEMQHGWQMEDFDRNIRFSRGRERLDLLRQRNRAVITQSMDMMQRQRTEDRFESTVDFQKEGNRLQETYFKENKKFQIEAQDMNKRHFEERRSLERQRMDMTKEQHEKQKSWMTERWALEDQRVLLDRQNIELQRQITEEVTAKTAEWQEKSIALQEAMTGIGTFFSDWSVELSNIAANAPKILEILQGIKNLGSIASGNITIQVGSSSYNLSQALNNAYALPQGPG